MPLRQTRNPEACALGSARGRAVGVQARPGSSLSRRWKLPAAVQSPRRPAEPGDREAAARPPSLPQHYRPPVMRAAAIFPEPGRLLLLLVSEERGRWARLRGAVAGGRRLAPLLPGGSRGRGRGREAAQPPRGAGVAAARLVWLSLIGCLRLGPGIGSRGGGSRLAWKSSLLAASPGEKRGLPFQPGWRGKAGVPVPRVPPKLGGCEQFWVLALAGRPRSSPLNKLRWVGK